MNNNEQNNLNQQPTQPVTPVVQTIVVEKHKSVFHIIIDIVLWIVVLGWAGVTFTDYYNFHNGKDAEFCIKQETKKYDDGTVDICTGAGYKIYYYNRASYKAKEFGPFWMAEKNTTAIVETTTTTPTETGGVVTN